MYKIYKILKNLEGIKSFLFFIILITFAFQKPRWCKLKQGMSKDCDFDSQKTRYYVSNILSLPEFVMQFSAFISYFCMFLLILSDVLFVLFIGPISYKLRVICMVICLGCDITFTVMEYVSNLWIFQWNIAPFFKIGFMILYSKPMRSAMSRLLWTAFHAYEALLVYGLNLTIWSGFSYIIFFSKSERQLPGSANLANTLFTFFPWLIDVLGNS